MKIRMPAVLVGAGLVAAVAIPTAGAYAAATTHHPAGAPVAHATHSTKHKAKTFTVTTKVTAVKIRTKPDSTKATKVRTTIKAADTALKVTCYKTGTAVNADATWYHTVAPQHGYVPGADLRIASEPMTGVPQCTTKATK